MDKHFVIIEVQGPHVWFANTWVGDPTDVFTKEDADREAESFRAARPTSRFIIVDIAP